MQQFSCYEEQICMDRIGMPVISKGFYGETLIWLVLTRSRHKCRPSQIAQGSSVCDHCGDPFSTDQPASGATYSTEDAVFVAVILKPVLCASSCPIRERESERD
ncbi:hypothetical protein NC653_008154 [Populus alba x Populus x berolinensis]|uniref:Uncharacterized protein n=1 Tax=Populus alba x Populus x berolinensis TaxID=444605 RepID=A0AAD6R622_9ROSI|nr:hypothetical protein NC653_008154 [Populus alba x Populus x berolinensis]